MPRPSPPPSPLPRPLPWRARLGGGWAALAMLLAPMAWAQSGDSAAARSSAVAQTVVGILSYAQWPGEQAQVRLCVVGATEYADELLLAGSGRGFLTGSRRLDVQRLRLDSPRLASDCDALYAGILSLAAWRELSQRLGSRPVLSISERPELCTVGGMFCLDVRQAGVSFEVNLDSVARSGVRVHPRVLQLARRRAHP